MTEIYYSIPWLKRLKETTNKMVESDDPWIIALHNVQQVHTVR